MKVLIAEDDLVSRSVLERTLRAWGYEVVAVNDGLAAWELLRQPDAPRLVILDWMMPGLDGPEVCRKVRELPDQEPTYIVLLTTRHLKEDVVAGLDSGADDYVVKPFDRQELHSRLRAGERIVGLQRSLSERVRELETALTQVRQLKGLLPICSYCKKIRDDDNYWHQVDAYLCTHTDVNFSHGICPTCWKTVEAEIAKPGLSCF
jgi:DNA-binding response OmpR family regulator